MAAASLRELLAEEGFNKRNFSKLRHKPVKLKDRTAPHESIVLPVYICHDRKDYNFSKPKVEQTDKPKGSLPEVSNYKPMLKTDETAIDYVAIKAVISILSDYVGNYIKDENFRDKIRGRCDSCLGRRRRQYSNEVVFINMKLAIKNIDKLLEDKPSRVELRMKTLRNSIQLLTIVATLNSAKTRNGETCGVPNSNLSACAQLFLSILYKLEKNNRISATHLLQVFCDAPFLARTHLLPDLWEHFFLPHLLHVKNWYDEEIEFITNWDYAEKEKSMNGISKVYNEQIDMGTVQFALYYKEWLKVGAKAPAIPNVPLPSTSSCRSRSSDSYNSHSPVNTNLYLAVFGPTLEQKSTDFCRRNSTSIYISDSEKNEEAEAVVEKVYTDDIAWTRKRSSSQPSTIPRPDFFNLLSCQSVITDCLINRNIITRDNSTRRDMQIKQASGDLSKSTTTLCCSNSLTECENSIRQITQAWLDSHGDTKIEAELSRTSVIEAMLDVMYASKDDEIIELAISILAEMVSRNEVIRETILNIDEQLEIFMQLLGSTSLFLKAAVLLYLLKPKATQMISDEWMVLILRLLEFGDQLQTLFTVRCSPQVAALYFIDQLITGFNEDINIENVNQLVSLGGLSLLVKSVERGGITERNKSASILSHCIQASENCRNYLVDNLDKASLLELIVLGNKESLNGSSTFGLLTDLLCLNRRTKILQFLKELKNGWGGLSTMQILLVYLQRAPPEQQPLVAAVLLQLDLLGDHLKCSVYREEAVDAIIASLDCRISSENVQEKAAQALLMLGKHFSPSAEATEKEWFLQLAEFCGSSRDSYNEKQIVVARNLDEEEEAIEVWKRKLAITLFNSGGERFLTVLTNSVANGTLNLARASLFTVSWMSSFFTSIGYKNFQSTAYSILVPQLLESSNSETTHENKLLDSFSLSILQGFQEPRSIESR